MLYVWPATGRFRLNQHLPKRRGQSFVVPVRVRDTVHGKPVVGFFSPESGIQHQKLHPPRCPPDGKPEPGSGFDMRRGVSRNRH